MVLIIQNLVFFYALWIKQNILPLLLDLCCQVVSSAYSLFYNTLTTAHKIINFLKLIPRKV